MKNKLFLTLAVIAWTLAVPGVFHSCTNTAPTDTTTGEKGPKVEVVAEAPDSLRFCATIAPTNKAKADRAVGQPSTYWEQNRALKIGFLGSPSAAQIAFFKACAGEIDSITNLVNIYPATGPYDIRVAFSPNASWSHIGRNALVITDQTKPTINIGWGWNDKNAAGVYTQGVVRHEFLHAVGAQHEQCNANSGICWNTANVYADYAQSGWDKAAVDYNVLFVCSGPNYQSTTWDSVSVMHYPVPARHRCSGPAIPQRQFLSAKDKAFWSNVYKITAPPPPATVTLTSAQIQALMASATSTRDLANDAVVKAQAGLNSALAAKSAATNNYNNTKATLGQ